MQYFNEHPLKHLSSLNSSQLFTEVEVNSTCYSPRSTCVVYAIIIHQTRIRLKNLIGREHPVNSE